VTARLVRVVIVEGSTSQRTELVRVLQQDGDIRVVGEAATASEVLTAIELHRPDVVTVDLDIGEGGGHRVIEDVMANAPTPILVLSAAVTDDRSESAVQALVGGALVALPKPVRWSPSDEEQLRRTVRSISKVPVIRHPRGRLRAARDRSPGVGLPHAVVAIAASTGGPASLATVLGNIGGLPAPVLVVQHIHPDFTEGLATWMRRVSALPVRVARHGEALEPAHVYIAPGNLHLRLAAGSRADLSAFPNSVHRPSADVLFASLAEHAGSDGIGVILSGMGDDGARGLLAMRRRNGRTIGQDESSCAVFGMPKAAVRVGAVTQLLGPEAIAASIKRFVSAGARSA
jgi:two-component system chemotaxis response regulator CheB